MSCDTSRVHREGEGNEDRCLEILYRYTICLDYIAGRNRVREQTHASRCRMCMQKSLNGRSRDVLAWYRPVLFIYTYIDQFVRMQLHFVTVDMITGNKPPRRRFGYTQSDQELMSARTQPYSRACNLRARPHRTHARVHTYTSRNPPRRFILQRTSYSRTLGI